MASASSRSSDMSTMSCAVPHVYETSSRTAADTRARGYAPARLDSARPTPHASAVPNTNPHKKPPVGPTSAPMPPMNPENTGRPSAPSKMYAITANIAVPRSSTATSMARTNVCRVNGTGPMGTMTWAETASNATITPARATCFASIEDPVLPWARIPRRAPCDKKTRTTRSRVGPSRAKWCPQRDSNP